jgi:hypothetical protein
LPTSLSEQIATLAKDVLMPSPGDSWELDNRVTLEERGDDDDDGDKVHEVGHL